MKNLFIIFMTIWTASAFCASSEENRSGKKYETTLQLGQDYRLPTNQVGLMYFLKPNDLVGLKLGSSKGQESQDNISLQYKHYFGNSFYLAGDIFYLRTREDTNGFFGDIFNLHEYASYSSMGSSLRLGNQWTWENFTLGCDWFGLGQRFGTFRKDSHKLTNTTITLLNVIIGFSF